MKRAYPAIVIVALCSALTADALAGAFNVQTENVVSPELVPSAALQAFHDGAYVLAASITETEGSSTSLAFAARAHIADAITRDDGLCLACLKKAEAAAEAALTAGASLDRRGYANGTDDPERRLTLAAANIQLSIAIGFHGRLLSAFEAQSEGLAERGRAAIDRALELDPSNAWGRASLGGWHLEIVCRAGSMLATTMYGASEEEGLKNFRAALAEDPNNLLLRYHYALSILALDPERFHDEALTTLEAGLKDSHDDAMTAFTRKRAFTLVEKLKAGPPDEIEPLVHRYQGYPTDTAQAGAH